ncbi:MAG TPA: nitroreductase family protein [Tenuifilaceae bacterium]|nr:nitroreductase family protein [Tenuifilaceae bacterium]HPE18577.1 nitroreductase family protein [Tenuifilaceae bacterium]HPJ46104.1 nitroreductase family protein [Tenuifilaceae bacterium]HPQ34411.1 nitroreductase family protein [Tenuifilaceae bacterium]HRX67807.1 nitroreductase family protein [Tenuifilaceae bacterium]
MNSINHDTCSSCNLCTEVCPAHIIIPSNGTPTAFDENKLHLCIKCGQCMAICATNSITIDGLEYGKDIVDLKEFAADYDRFRCFLLQRRSVRNFSDVPVPNMVIEKIIDSVSLAPFGADASNINITVVNNKDILANALPLLSNFYNNIEKWFKNPFIRYMIRRNAGENSYRTLRDHILPMVKIGHYDIKNGIDNITRRAPSLIIFHSQKGTPEAIEDSHIKLTYALLATHALGLGATAIGLIPPAINKDKKIREVFQIPQSEVALASLIIGYPKYHLKKGVVRRRFNVNYLSNETVK